MNRVQLAEARSALERATAEHSWAQSPAPWQKRCDSNHGDSSCSSRPQYGSTARHCRGRRPPPHDKMTGRRNDRHAPRAQRLGRTQNRRGQKRNVPPHARRHTPEPRGCGYSPAAGWQRQARGWRTCCSWLQPLHSFGRAQPQNNSVETKVCGAIAKAAGRSRACQMQSHITSASALACSFLILRSMSLAICSLISSSFLLIFSRPSSSPRPRSRSTPRHEHL